MAKEALIGYSMKDKKKMPFKGTPEITKNSNGGYMAKGETEDGNKMCVTISKENALKAIENGQASKGF
jgi:hypothetical protein